MSGSCQQALVGIHNSICFFVTVYVMNPHVRQSLDGLSFSFCSTLCLHICSCEYFISLPKKDQKAPTFWSSFLSFMWSVNCILGIQSFWANIHLSVRTCHMCSFVTGLPHSGRRQQSCENVSYSDKQD